VHGISVSGPTFPATIWNLFMRRAHYFAPFPNEFPEPKTEPIWRSRTLQYAMEGTYYEQPTYSGPSSEPQQEAPAEDSGDGFVQVPESDD
jgi:hypothetical protein